MSSQTIDQIIQDWCSATGTSAWNSNETKYAWINDNPVCMTFAEDSGTSVMHVHCALGSFAKQDLYKKMLEINLPMHPLVNGSYGRDPKSGEVIYRIDVPLESSICGNDLPQHINTLIQAARERLLSH